MNATSFGRILVFPPGNTSQKTAFPPHSAVEDHLALTPSSICFKDCEFAYPSRSGQGHQEPPTLATAAAGLAPIANASEAWRRSTGGRVLLGDRWFPRNRPPRRAAVISAVGQFRPSTYVPNRSKAVRQGNILYVAADLVKCSERVPTDGKRPIRPLRCYSCWVA